MVNKANAKIWGVNKVFYGNVKVVNEFIISQS